MAGFGRPEKEEGIGTTLKPQKPLKSEEAPRSL